MGAGKRKRIFAKFKIKKTIYLLLFLSSILIYWSHYKTQTEFRRDFKILEEINEELTLMKSILSSFVSLTSDFFIILIEPNLNISHLSLDVRESLSN